MLVGCKIGYNGLVINHAQIQIRRDQVKFCEQCGAELAKDDKFCEQCGKVVAEEVKEKKEETETKEPAEKEQSVGNKERKSLTKEQRIIGASVIGIIVVLFSVYQLGSFLYSPERQTDKIVKAISAKNSKQLAGVTTSTDSDFEVTEDSLENFTSYLDENPDYLSWMVSELTDYGSYDSFYIGESGKKFGLYPAYELFMTPVYGTVYTNAAGVAISLGEKELFLSDSEEFTREVGPFAPGILEFSAEGEMNGFPLSVAEEVTWLNGDSYHEVNLSLTGEYFTVRSDLENADVYINDQVIGQLENGYGDFGPIPVTDGMTIHVSQIFGEEEVSSDAQKLTKDNSYYEFDNVVLGSTDEATRVLRNAYSTAAQLTRNYESYADDYTKYYHPKGPAYEEQRLAFLSFGESMDADEDINRVDFDVTTDKVERTTSNTFAIEYEVTYRTYHSYGSDNEDSLRHYSKEATIIFEPTNHPDRDYDVLIYDIQNEELVYEE